MSQLPPCPTCACAYTYEMGALLVCPECAHEWSPEIETSEGESDEPSVIRDSSGNVLADGDTVTVLDAQQRRHGFIEELRIHIGRLLEDDDIPTGALGGTDLRRQEQR